VIHIIPGAHIEETALLGGTNRSVSGETNTTTATGMSQDLPLAIISRDMSANFLETYFFLDHRTTAMI